MILGDKLNRKNLPPYLEYEVWVCNKCGEVYDINDSRFNNKFPKQSHFCRYCGKGMLEKISSDEILNKYSYEKPTE